MKIDIYLKIPSPYIDVEAVKAVIGKSSVKAYSLSENCEIIEGIGKIGNNGRYNYHNNYDTSQDAMFFNGVEKWFTLSESRIKEVYDENVEVIRKELTKILDKL